MLQIGVDWVALSFVQRSLDIEEIMQLIDEKLSPGQCTPCIVIVFLSRARSLVSCIYTLYSQSSLTALSTAKTNIQTTLRSGRGSLKSLMAQR